MVWCPYSLFFIWKASKIPSEDKMDEDGDVSMDEQKPNDPADLSAYKLDEYDDVSKSTG